MIKINYTEEAPKPGPPDKDWPRSTPVLLPCAARWSRLKNTIINHGKYFKFMTPNFVYGIGKTGLVIYYTFNKHICIHEIRSENRFGAVTNKYALMRGKF